MKPAQLSIVIPCLDEARGIGATLASLADARHRGAEVIVVDGGSSDETLELARPGADAVVSAPRGRARQMNAGAEVAKGDILLFLHADTRLPHEADCLLLASLAETGKRWGRFDVQIEGKNPLLRVVAAMMNGRSRLTGIATGDQAIFVTRDLFDEVGRFPQIPLMEDIAITARLRHLARPLCLRAPVTTSGRRWERHGVVRTVLLMWRLRLAFWLGASPHRLAREYVHHRSG